MLRKILTTIIAVLLMILIGCDRFQNPTTEDSTMILVGIVTDESGNPLKDVIVSTEPLTENVFTKEDGGYAIHIEKPAKSYTVTATYNGQTVRRHVDARNGIVVADIKFGNNPAKAGDNPGTGEKDTPLPPDHIRITGQVRVPDGQPAKGSLVYADEPLAGIFTDEEGMYTIDLAVQEKVYTIFAKKGDLLGSIQIQTAKGSQRADIQLGIIHAGINVYVFDEENKPIKGAFVEIPGGQSGLTDENGFLSLQNLNPNSDYLINVSKKGSELKTISVRTPDKNFLKKVVILVKTGVLEVEPELIDFGNEKNIATIVLQAKSGAAFAVLREDEEWLELSDVKLLVEPNKPEIVTVKLLREKLKEGKNEALITVRGPNSFFFIVKVIAEK